LLCDLSRQTLLLLELLNMSSSIGLQSGSQGPELCDMHAYAYQYPSDMMFYTVSWQFEHVTLVAQLCNVS
jgi:hypothetical protein